MKRFLVTGGAGFIGSHLCAALRSDDANVRVLDDLSTSPGLGYLSPDVELIVGDVADPGVVEAALADVDGVFHLAAITSVPRCTDAWVASHRVNLAGTIAVFDAVRRSGRRIPVVYASSAAVYGRPLSAYGADKKACELHAEVASAIHGIPTAGLRLFNVYGPGQDASSPYSGVVSIFCMRLSVGLPIDIHGTGEQSRDFIHVADVVRAMRETMQRLLDGWTPDAPFEVCTGKSTTILTLANIIAALIGRPPQIRFVAPRRGDILRSVGNPAAMRKHLGLWPLTPLKAGLRELIVHGAPPPPPRPPKSAPSLPRNGRRA